MPKARDFRAQQGGGGAFTTTINQPLGSILALVASRHGLRPTVLTLLNLTLSAATSILFATSWRVFRDGGTEAWLVGGAVFAGWQLAYSLDCADGQLARETQQTSAAGARVDILCDLALQTVLVAAIVSVTHELRPHTPIWLDGVFAAAWIANLCVSAIPDERTTPPVFRPSSFKANLIKLLRDYGVIITITPIALVLYPTSIVWIMIAVTVINTGYLAASIAVDARTSLRENGPCGNL